MLLFVKRFIYATYVVLESAIDTRFSIRYSRSSDRFTIQDYSEMPLYDAARVTIGDANDFILFDNDRPGFFRSASHGGLNQLAIDALSLAIFDRNYQLLCECLREGAEIYKTEERSAEVIVPYSNSRRLARIALHTQADNASQEVLDLHHLITTQQKRLSITFGDDVDGEGQQLSA
jgi:hypothetical protein